jgi:hypothetical protein
MLDLDGEDENRKKVIRAANLLVQSGIIYVGEDGTYSYDGTFDLLVHLLPIPDSKPNSPFDKWYRAIIARGWGGKPYYYLSNAKNNKAFSYCKFCGCPGIVRKYFYLSREESREIEPSTFLDKGACRYFCEVK